MRDSAAFLSTGNDSPVNIDSSTLNAVALISMASATIRSPSLTNITSPTTTSLLGIRTCTPSRNTSASGSAISFNLDNACSVRRSCNTVIKTTMTSEADKATASRNSPKKIYMLHAANSSKNMGSESTSRTIKGRLRTLFPGNSFAPCAVSRA